MKLNIREHCIRCGLCEDLHPRLFKLNTAEDRVDLLWDVVPPELEDEARQAIADCAVTAIFMNDAQKVREPNRITEELSVDVAVMGSGLAGLTAAVTMARKGARVAVFEKRPFQGGSVSNTPIGTKSVPTDPAYQAAAFKSIFQYSNFNGNPGVIRAWISGTSRIPEYAQFIGANLKLLNKIKLENVGTEREHPVGFPAGFTNIGDKYRLVGRGKGHGAALVCLKSVEKLRELGGQIYLDSPVVDLLQEGGKVVGLVARNNRNALLLSTGRCAPRPVCFCK